MTKLLLCLLVASSCTSPHQKGKVFETRDFGPFTIDVPETWKKVDVQGMDSYVGMIAIDETDTLSFDLGWYSNSLEDDSYTVKNDEFYVMEEILENKEPTHNSIYISVGLVGEVDTSKYIRNEISWVEIDKRKANWLDLRNLVLEL